MSSQIIITSALVGCHELQMKFCEHWHNLYDVQSGSDVTSTGSKIVDGQILDNKHKNDNNKF